MKKQPKKAPVKTKKPTAKAKARAVKKTAAPRTAKAKAEPKITRVTALALAPLFDGNPDDNMYTVAGADFEKVATERGPAVQFNGAPKGYVLSSVPKGTAISLSAVKESMGVAKGGMKEVLATRALHAFLHPLVAMVTEITKGKEKTEPAKVEVAVTAKPAPVAKATLLKASLPVFLPDELFVKASDRMGRMIARVEGDYVIGLRGARILVQVIKSRQQGTFFILKQVESGSTLHGTCKEGTSVSSRWLDRGINPAENVGDGVKDREALHAFLMSFFSRYIDKVNKRKKAEQIAAQKAAKAKAKSVAKPVATVTPEAPVAVQPKGANGDKQPATGIPLPAVNLKGVPAGTQLH